MPIWTKQGMTDMQEKPNQKENGSSKRTEIPFQPINYSAEMQVQYCQILFLSNSWKSRFCVKSANFTYL